ncbi:MAG TPA: protein phosphatase 2C domain-containing protein [Gemmataceae bacterium]|nr:protein phosphatase 2C domain-containing protein [Gemmataceae bacterium]
MTRFDQIEHASLTDVGVRRSHNQDSHAIQLARDDEQWQQRGHLFLVADGMGAHAVGEKASEQAAGLVPHNYHKYVQQGPKAALRKAFAEANASIHACGQANREFHGMGTTTTALLIRPEGAWIGHVGDSRAYRIRNGLIEQLSYDHSWVWEYARLKRIDPSEVQDIPSNVIHRCLGPEPLVQVDIEGPHPIQSGDIFLLCSDGLSGPVTDHEIGAIASALPPAEACRLLIDLANLRGGLDNITVVIVRVGGPAVDANGVVPTLRSRGRSFLPKLPWWPFALLAGTLLVVLAIVLEFRRWPATAGFVFVLAFAAIVAGLVGLIVHYRRERLRAASEDDDEPAAPRIHRQTTCRIQQPLLDRLVRAVKTLHQHAQEKHWSPDWKSYEEHVAAAESLLHKNDLPGAFREYCRALLPLTRALHKQRNKEESFQPLWDKTQ